MNLVIVLVIEYVFAIVFENSAVAVFAVALTSAVGVTFLWMAAEAVDVARVMQFDFHLNTMTQRQLTLSDSGALGSPG